MKKKQKNLKPKVLFNASVVLAGLRSPEGGSGKLLLFVRKSLIEGRISEIIFDEVLGHSKQLGLSTNFVGKKCLKLFGTLLPSPNEELVIKYKKIVIDEGDAHVLASCFEAKVKFLATLDRKHLLVLKGKIRGLKIVTPGELIELLSK